MAGVNEYLVAVQNFAWFQAWYSQQRSRRLVNCWYFDNLNYVRFVNAFVVVKNELKTLFREGQCLF